MCESYSFQGNNISILIISKKGTARAKRQHIQRKKREQIFSPQICQFKVNSKVGTRKAKSHPDSVAGKDGIYPKGLITCQGQNWRPGNKSVFFFIAPNITPPPP